ncbi:OmpA family protein [Flavobacterium lindanitolerans]|jgi:outer membrane protein OmpA-like peptidoglycan-associated protein/tetratricopeptide (TPR) repeat protein|uniref:OmpA family protein n=1 Tax=Flavobacterium lindanitolerans TaxID=428988 RepID=UPI0023F51A5C|nr:OmpA family protein [Flavobacterium lindanitolerans]
MKKIYIAAGLFLAIASGYGQNRSSEKADRLYDSYQYVAAIEEYLKLAEGNKGDSHVYRQLADSYYNVFNMGEAARWYAKAAESSQDAETYYRYAQALKSQGKYQEANRQMDRFAALLPNDQRAKDHKANPDYIPSLSNRGRLFDISETSISSKDQGDFGAVLSNDNILYFVSTRNSSNRTDKWVRQPYLDIFQSVRNADGTLSEPRAVSELNTAFHDGPVTVSADGNTMFFARDGLNDGNFDRDRKNNVKIGQQGLYRATRVDGKWTDIQALPFNSKSYSVTHPSLSPDGKTLYFTSNMPGGHGDSDIWKVSVDGSNYGKPQNLGPNVNTAGKEGFPSIGENGILYFASSGKQGFGGLDVFRADLNRDGEAVNVGKPVNSEKDDFSFSFNTSKNEGYFSSNRNGTDDIIRAVPVCRVEAIAMVKDGKTGRALPGAGVSILDARKNVIATKQSDSKGEVSFDVDCDTEYVLQATKKDYEAGSGRVGKTKGGRTSVDISLEPVEVVITDTEVILKSIYFEFDRSNITQQGAAELDKLVNVMDRYPDMVIYVKSHTDGKGSAAYNLRLSEQRAQSTVQYLVSKGISKDRVSGKGFGSTEPKVDCRANCTEEEDAQNRRSEFKIIKR